jgi:hypothetical protein
MTNPYFAKTSTKTKKGLAKILCMITGTCKYNRNGCELRFGSNIKVKQVEGALHIGTHSFYLFCFEIKVAVGPQK